MPSTFSVVRDIHPNLEKYTKCYADDIVSWHTGRCIVGSELILQKFLTGIERWTQILKLMLAAEKKTHTVSMQINCPVIY